MFYNEWNEYNSNKYKILHTRTIIPTCLKNLQ